MPIHFLVVMLAASDVTIDIHMRPASYVLWSGINCHCSSGMLSPYSCALLSVFCVAQCSCNVAIEKVSLCTFNTYTEIWSFYRANLQTLCK